MRELRSLGSRNPIAALKKRGGFVRASLGQPIFLSACCPQQDRAQYRGCEARDNRGFLLDFAAQLVDLLTHTAIDFLELFLHYPKRCIVCAADLLHFPLEPLADPRRSEERRVGKECRSRWS